MPQLQKIVNDGQLELSKTLSDQKKDLDEFQAKFKSDLSMMQTIPMFKTKLENLERQTVMEKEAAEMEKEISELKVGVDRAKELSAAIKDKEMALEISKKLNQDKLEEKLKLTDELKVLESCLAADTQLKEALSEEKEQIAASQEDMDQSAALTASGDAPIVEAMTERQDVMLNTPSKVQKQLFPFTSPMEIDQGKSVNSSIRLSSQVKERPLQWSLNSATKRGGHASPQLKSTPESQPKQKLADRVTKLGKSFLPRLSFPSFGLKKISSPSNTSTAEAPKKLLPAFEKKASNIPAPQKAPKTLVPSFEKRSSKPFATLESPRTLMPRSEKKIFSPSHENIAKNKPDNAFMQPKFQLLNSRGSGLETRRGKEASQVSDQGNTTAGGDDRNDNLEIGADNDKADDSFGSSLMDKSYDFSMTDKTMDFSCNFSSVFGCDDKKEGDDGTENDQKDNSGNGGSFLLNFGGSGEKFGGFNNGFLF